MNDMNNCAGCEALTPISPRYDRRDRLLLLAAFLAGYALVELFRVTLTLHQWSSPGAAAALTAIALMGAAVWYCREKRPLRAENLPLLLPPLVTAATLLIFSDSAMKLLNIFACAATCCLWAFCSCGIVGDRKSPALISRSLKSWFTLRYKNLARPFGAFASLFRVRDKNALYLLLGLLAALPILALVTALLASADAVFSHVVGSAAQALSGNAAEYAARALVGAVFGLFIFSALWSLRRDAAAPAAPRERRGLSPVFTNTVLASVVLVYLLFVVIQFAYLFGGASQVALTGVSYSDYARSGFFELVFVSIVNLTIALTAVCLSRRGGAGHLAARVLSTVLLGETGVVLASAAMRMRLYVAAYGLSTLRALTIWGMALIALWLIAAAVRIWARGVRFFPLLMSSAIAAWLILSCANLSGVVANYNAGSYISGETETIDTDYLRTLGVSSMDAVEKLQVYALEHPEDASVGMDALLTLENELKDLAREECAQWQTWSLQSYLLSGRT